jgi:protein-tyrosine phosphatase
MTIPRIATICHGNIARSQVLEHYLRQALAGLGVEVDLFSCGTAPAEAYPDAAGLLRDVHEQLERRGLDVTVERTPWDAGVAEAVRVCDLVLAADAARRGDVLERTGMESARVQLFYEYIGEGSVDFVDTFDHARGRQDPARYARSFDELERIARLAAARIAGSLRGDTRSEE